MGMRGLLFFRPPKRHRGSSSHRHVARMHVLSADQPHPALSQRPLEPDGYSQPATSANDCWSDGDRDTITDASIEDQTGLPLYRFGDAAEGETPRARDEAPEGSGKRGSVETEVDDGIRIGFAGGRQ